MIAMKNIIIITGASSGIGQEFALQIDTAFSNIDEIWMIARREERLMEVGKVMEHKVKMISMDVTDEYAMDDFEELLEKEDVTVRMLINAAGFGLMGPFDELSLEEQTDMLYVNCEALTKMTYICLPYMARGSRIIQMASAAAFVPQQDFAVYAATKAYVLSFSRALNQELCDYGLYVTAVCPGPVDTPFFEVSGKLPGGMKEAVMADPVQVVKQALIDAKYKKEVSVYGTAMKGAEAATKVLPHGMILKAMSMMEKITKE